ncbi:MAG TPA: IS1182 family transposase [Candidatus Binatia bacterium]|nr:IS1182 family transposase [Candidatus Binatia bacterium]
MARYKPIDLSPKLIPVDYARQILPGSFESALCYLIDHEIDLAAFTQRYRNDEGGAPAYAPALLLKIILLAYSRGLVSSRAMESACRQNVLFMAVGGGATPHWTTLAAFVSSGGEALSQLFTQVLVVCDRQGLIGRQLFAIDGVKLPSNASKARSGTRKEFRREAKKMERAVQRMLARHRQEDLTHTYEPSLRKREVRQVERLKQEAAKIRTWLQVHRDDRRGVRGAIRKSNRTDNESAKMATGKGVIQGYTGVAVVDEQHQIIVDAQAHGVGQEQELLAPAVEAIQTLRTEATIITADAGYHSEANLKQLAMQGIDAYLPDSGYRKRDPRYAGQEQHRSKPAPLYNKAPQPQQLRLFRPQDFHVAEDRSPWVCPAGARLYRNGHHRDRRGMVALKLTGRKTACGGCTLRVRCLRAPAATPVRQVSLILGPTVGKPETYTARMKRKIDSALGREMITRRFATVEPVFGNLRHNKRLSRFTLRGRAKVEGQWKLYCLVHNIEKLAHLGYARCT